MAAVLTDVGEGLLVDYFQAADEFFVAHGTGGTTADKGDTALGTEVDSRVTGTESQPTADVARFVAEIACGATQAVIEVGVFDENAVGNMLVRKDFSAINVNDGDSIEYTIDIEFA